MSAPDSGYKEMNLGHVASKRFVGDLVGSFAKVLVHD